MTLIKLYSALLKEYGPQGWWPLISASGLAGRDTRGYLSLQYEALPATFAFEVSLGAILTQNAAWINAERALIALVESGLITPNSILDFPVEELARLIRPAGYFNMKAKKLKYLAAFFLSLKKKAEHYLPPDRKDLLDVWGVGPETADSILLYAFALPYFVVDAYTRRVLGRLGILSADLPYEEMRRDIEAEVPAVPSIYNEFHALLVEHSKRYCRAKPLCPACFLRKTCPNAHLLMPKPEEV